MATALDFKERGNALYQRKEYAEAVAMYDRSLALDPAQHAVFTNRASAKHAMRDYEGALADATASTALCEGWTKGHYRRGAALVALERYDDAIEAYQTGLERDPSNAQVRAGLAHATALRSQQPRDHADAKARGNQCYGEGKYEAAIAWYGKGLSMCDAGEEPEAAATLLTNRAECHRQLCEIKAVVADCTAALGHSPNNVKAFLRRGLAFEFLEKYQEAAGDFRRAMALDPGGTIATEGLRRVSAFAGASV